MNYETMDWELEARRVAWAFGVSEECSFEEQLFYDYWHDPPIPYICRDLLWRSGKLTPIILEGKERFFRCEYRKNQGRWYHVFLDAGTPLTSITIDWDGRILSWGKTAQFAPLFAKGLYRLDLLLPEVEAELNISVMAHQKLEWAREYEERYGL